MLKKLLISVLLVISLTSCSRGDFWGNPLPPPDESCPTRTVPVPEVPFTPNNGRRPAEIPPGWKWQTIILQVRALNPKGGRVWTTNEYCVPFAVHVYGNVSGDIPFVLFDSGVAHELPYSKPRVTPWTTWFVIGYDPESPRFKGHQTPKYYVDLQATYQAERDANQTGYRGVPEAFGCTISLRKVTTVIASDTRAKPGTKPGDALVRCKHTGDRWFPYEDS